MKQDKQVSKKGRTKIIASYSTIRDTTKLHVKVIIAYRIVKEPPKAAMLCFPLNLLFQECNLAFPVNEKSQETGLMKNLTDGAEMHIESDVS